MPGSISNVSLIQAKLVPNPIQEQAGIREKQFRTSPSDPKRKFVFESETRIF